jgi:hypothetical protein
MTDYEDNAVTAIGDGQTDLRLRGIAHYQFDGPFWASLESGYDWRNDGPHDEIPINVTLGAAVAEWLTIMPFYSQVVSRGGIDLPQVPAQGGFPDVKEEYTRFGVGFYAPVFESFGLTGWYRTTTDGLNTGEVDGFSLGLVLRL